MSGYDMLEDSDEAALTERRPAGMPPGTFRAVVAIVVVLLLINVYAVYLLVDFPDGEIEEEDDGPDVDHPWDRMIEPMEISDDVVWDGMEGRLETPVRVMEGGHLTVVDSDIDLLYEDMLWFNGSYFEVEPGGTLEFVDSTIEVVSGELDPNILVGPFNSQYDIPAVSRVVNLAGTSEPLLSFDLRWFFNGTPLNVAIQPTPESALISLGSLDPQGPCEGWEHYEYSLEFYVGTTPRVVIYLPEYPDDVFMIRNLNVTDGGMDLPFDLPYNSSAWSRGWMTHGFAPLRTAMQMRGVFQSIIITEGDVIIKGSTITVPIDHERWGYTHRDKERYYGNSYWYSKNWYISVGGMEISSSLGNLTIEDSYLENVPVEANDSSVSVLDTHFTSGYDMLTLYMSSGSVEGSTFEFTGIGDGLRYWDEENGRALWAISVENNSEKEPLVVRDCRFENVQQAIDLTEAKVHVEGCDFEGVTKLAIWDHRSEGIDTWEHLASDNSFRSCTGFLYLKTGLTEISFNGSDVGWSGDQALDTDGKVIRDYGIYRDLGVRRDYEVDNIFHLISPDVLVETEQRVRVIDHINVSVWGEVTQPNPMYGRVNLTIQPGSESIHVDLYPLLVDQIGYELEDIRSPIYVRGIWPFPEYSEGAYMISIDIGIRYLHALNITFDMYLDDRFLFHYNETVIYENRDGRAWVKFYPVIEFEPGAHDLTLVVSGNVMLDLNNVSDERTEIENSTFRFMRATKNNTSEEVREFLGSNEVYLLLDEGTSFDLIGLEPLNLTDQRHTLYISSMNNTSLTFRNMDYLENMTLAIIYELPLNITIIDSNLAGLSIYQRESFEVSGLYPYSYPFKIVCSLTIENSTLGSTELSMTQCAIRIADTTISTILWISATYNATLEMINCHMIDTYFCMIDGAIWSVTIKDCSFSTYPEGGFYLDADGMLEVTFMRTIFEDCKLMIRLEAFRYVGWDLVVTNCTFQGNRSYLAVLWDLMEKRDWEDNPSVFPVPNGTIDGNTFSGPTSGMVLHHDLFGELLGDNDLKDGASVWAWYKPKLSAVPMKDGYSERTYFIILSTEEYMEDFPFEPDWNYDIEHYFLDVTADPLSALAPEPIHVAIRWDPPGSYYCVAAFDAIDMTVDTNEILYPIWPDLQGTLTDYIEDWPWPMKHYKGPNW
ncbi:MAG: hypothetical protein GQ558_05985 [Thermoplasmata archaeon]|nr:hypothetical protein [Thermoplasmata archaeon]